MRVGVFEAGVVGGDIHGSNDRARIPDLAADSRCGQNFIQRLAQALSFPGGYPAAQPEQIVPFECHGKRLFWHEHTISSEHSLKQRRGCAAQIEAISRT